MLILLGENSKEPFALGGGNGAGRSHFAAIAKYKDLCPLPLVEIRVGLRGSGRFHGFSDTFSFF